MLANHSPPPRGSGKAAVLILGIVALMMVTIFVGFNLYHADTLHEQQSGQVEPTDAPKGPKDLQTPPVQPR